MSTLLTYYFSTSMYVTTASTLPYAAGSKSLRPAPTAVHALPHALPSERLIPVIASLLTLKRVSALRLLVCICSIVYCGVSDSRRFFNNATPTLNGDGDGSGPAVLSSATAPSVLNDLIPLGTGQMSGGRSSYDTGDDRWLSLAWQDRRRFDKALAKRTGPNTVGLDLSNNMFTKFRFLRWYTVLETLVLDGNDLTSLDIPVLPTLTTLWLNKNRFDNLKDLVERLATHTPALVHLSMLNNPCAPSWTNGGTTLQYIHFRSYVAAKLPELASLDCSIIDEEERVQGNSMLYSTVTTQPAPDTPAHDTPQQSSDGTFVRAEISHGHAVQRRLHTAVASGSSANPAGSLELSSIAHNCDSGSSHVSEEDAGPLFSDDEDDECNSENFGELVVTDKLESTLSESPVSSFRAEPSNACIVPPTAAGHASLLDGIQSAAQSLVPQFCGESSDELAPSLPRKPISLLDEIRNAGGNPAQRLCGKSSGDCIPSPPLKMPQSGGMQSELRAALKDCARRGKMASDEPAESLQSLVGARRVSMRADGSDPEDDDDGEWD